MTTAQDEPDAPAINERPGLTLRAGPGLPTHCYFLANARRASVIWTRDDFRALCHRMLNGNGEHEFLLCYRDAQEKTKFSKAYRAKPARASTGRSIQSVEQQSEKLASVFIRATATMSRAGGALDFDAHNPAERIGRAYIFAGKAFDLLCREAPNVWLIAGTSGESGGWHVFVFAPFFYSTGEWARFLREVADRIGVPIQKGICEISPVITAD